MEETKQPTIPPPIPSATTHVEWYLRLRWRFILTLLVSGVLLAHSFNFGAHPSAGTHAFGMLILAASTSLIVFNCMGIRKNWTKYKFLTLLPLLLMIGSCAAVGPVGRYGFDSRINQFKANQARYDDIVRKVVYREIPNPTIHDIRSVKSSSNYVAFATPLEYQKLVPYLITADREGTNTVAVRLVLCVMFPNHHRGYIWCPDGQFEKHLRTWEYISERISDKWCAISD